MWENESIDRADREFGKEGSLRGKGKTPILVTLNQNLQEEVSADREKGKAE